MARCKLADVRLDISIHESDMDNCIMMCDLVITCPSSQVSRDVEVNTTIFISIQIGQQGFGVLVLLSLDTLPDVLVAVSQSL